MKILLTKATKGIKIKTQNGNKKTLSDIRKGRAYEKI